ncbi:uncharacterized protein PAC_13981 [Phialocephala subalpina]|uniref:BZIP domain-containing protein n=1 Tax=Phialocephala subalpina TaxID=576137 RepID=A0A1L7XGD7_9HELO|nr:uncharacterized protein PAC_13981 [Phialocephala subalpina]
MVSNHLPSFLLALYKCIYLMAQVDSIKPMGAANTIPHPSQQPSTGQVLQSAENATESFEKARQETSNQQEKRVAEPDLMDDDVQLVLSVPRRRKKKRKRFGYRQFETPYSFYHRFTFSPSLLGQCQETQPFPKEMPKVESKGVESSTRRKSTSVVQRLESCHIGDKDTGLRRGSLPAVPMTAPFQQASWSPDPAYCTNQPPQYSSFPAQVPWWDEPTTPLPHLSVSASSWTPWQPHDSIPKKRKYECGWQDGNPARKHYRSSTQISPRTTPVSMPSQTRFNCQQPSGAMSNTYERQMSDHSTSMAWPSFDWEPYRVVNPNPQYVSPYTQATVLVDIGDSNQNSVSHQQSFQDWPQGANLFQQDFDSNQGNHNMVSPSKNTSRLPMVTGGFPGQQSSQISAVQPTFMGSPPQQPPTPTSPANRIPPVPPPNSVDRQAATFAINGPPTLAPIVTSRPIVRNPETSDILRKPSLYAIPAWPPAPSPPIHTSSSASPGVPPSTVNPNPINQDSGRRTTLHNSGTSPTTQQLPGTVPQRRPASTTNISLNANGPPSTSPSNPPTPRDQSPTPRNEDFQIPRARAGRKHSPNLIVDIAETCQSVFPFTLIAERHSVPLQKVFDTFSAIIQLPLLRNADDRRRHGSLGKRRTKEFREAKKAMERAQEEERKVEMRKKRDSMLQGGERGQGSGGGNGGGRGGGSVTGKGLLKAAIWNNAGKSRG